MRRKIKCKDTLWLLDAIIDGSEGIPIGNYISQYFGNLFLSRLDHSIKEIFKIKNYFRYCDDVLIMSNDKEELWRILEFIEGHFKDINLKVKENHQLYQIGDRGVSCLGYIVYRNRVDLKRNIIENFSKKLHKMERAKRVDMKSLGSYYGWFKHCDSYGLWIKLTDRLSKNVSRVDAILLNKLTTKLKYKSGVANAYRKKQHKAKPTSEASRKASVNVLVKELLDDSFEYVQLILSPNSSVDAIIEAVEKVYVERIKEMNMNCLDSIRAKLAGVEKDYDDAVVIDVEFDSTLLWAELNLIIKELGSVE